MKDLLFLLCQYPWDPGKNTLLEQYLSEIRDWDNLVKLLNDHGIIALAAYNIKVSGLENLVPSASMKALENGLMRNIARNTWLKERWKEIDSILTDAGISHILLKGMALEFTLYGGKGLRQMNDNDLLINQTNAGRAWLILKQNGFTQEPFKSALFNRIKPHPGIHFPALTSHGYTVEIHYDLPEHEFPSEHEIEEISIDSQRALILKKELHINYLMNHFARHAGTGECQLRLYADIKMLDRSGVVEFPEKFIFEPLQSHKIKFRKTLYRRTIRSIQPRYRIWFIIGDMFPSISWMKKRYKCDFFAAIIRYPFRIGKLTWLIGF